MKQIDECLRKAFSGKLPTPSRKWKGFIQRNEQGGFSLHLFHYQHLILIYDLDINRVTYEWWEKRTDKRGLDSAKKWIEENQDIIKEFRSKLVEITYI